MKRRNFLLLFMILSCAFAGAQNPFSYKRSITGVSREGWHSLTLPPGIFKHMNTDLSDFRLYQVNENDTVEVPYLREVRQDEATLETVLLPLFNKSYRDGVLYLMFELDHAQQVNHLDLAFAEHNYFGLVTIEGSDDRTKWFDITKDQRIVAIEKDSEDYTLSSVKFPITDYRFLRVSIRSDTPLTFRKASFSHQVIQPGSFHEVPLTWHITSDRKSGTSVVDIAFHDYGPVNSLSIKIGSARDYYRSFRMEYMRDSTQTEKGWIKHYGTVYEGHLTSYAANNFTFDWTLAKEMRLVIRDRDNAPLIIDGLAVKGPDVRVVCQLQPGNNFMLYGAAGLRPASYDLAFFQNKIPEKVATAQLGPEESIAGDEPVTRPLFENGLWLWGVMGIMIVGMGYFTVQMMKKDTGPGR